MTTVAPFAHRPALLDEVEQQVGGIADRGLTRPLAPSGTTCADTPLVWSVISVTCAASAETAETLPTRPSPVTTGWSTRTPWSEPLSIVIVEYQTVGERAITRAATRR